MSHLVSRILLSIFLLPLAVITYGVSMGVMSRGSHMGSDEITDFVICDLLSWGIVGAYWLAIWYSSVNWTSRRIGQTAVAALLAAAGGFAISLVVAKLTMEGSDFQSFTAFFAGVLAVLLWLIATIFIWRETTAERAARIASAGKGAISCPNCGYNLTGLGEARCPECGAKYTLDELFASQPDPKADIG